MSSPLERYLRDFPALREKPLDELLEELYSNSELQEGWGSFVQRLTTDPDDPSGAVKATRGRIKREKPPDEADPYRDEPLAPFEKGLTRGLLGGAASVIETITPGETRFAGRDKDKNQLDALREKMQGASEYLRSYPKDPTPPTTGGEIAAEIGGNVVASVPWAIFNWQRGWLWWMAMGRKEAEDEAKAHPNRETTGIPSAMGSPDKPGVRIPFVEKPGIPIPFTEKRIGEDWIWLPNVVGKDLIPQITPKSWHKKPEDGGATTWEQIRDAMTMGGLRAYMGWVSTRLAAQGALQQGIQFGGTTGMADVALGKNNEQMVVDTVLGFMMGAGVAKLSPTVKEKLETAKAEAAAGNYRGAGAHLNEMFNEEGVREHMARSVYMQMSADAEAAIKDANGRLLDNEKSIRKLRVGAQSGDRQALDRLLELQDENELISSELYQLYGYKAQGKPPDLVGTDQKGMFEASRDAEAALASQLAVQQRRMSEQAQFFTEAELTFKGITDVERKALMNSIMRGEPIPEKYQYVIGRFEKMFDELYRGDQGLGIKYTYMKDYWPLMWKPKDEPGARKLAAHMVGRPNFSKQKVFSDVAEGEAAGFELRTTNPAVMAVWRYEAGLRAQARMQSLKMFEDIGLAIKEEKIKYASPPPDAGPNWRPPQPPELEDWTQFNNGGQNYRLHPQAQLYFERAFGLDRTYLSDMLPFEKGGITERSVANIGTAWMAGRNATIPLKLSLSGFHAKHVLDIAMVNMIVPAVAQKLSGRLSWEDFLTSVKKSDVIGSYAAGNRVMQNFSRPWKDLTQMEQADQSLMLAGGYNPRQPDIYQLRTEQNLRRTINDQLKTYNEQWNDASKVEKLALGLNIGAADAKVLALKAGQMIEEMQHSLFSDWIPAMKTDAYLNEAKHVLRGRPELLEPGNEKAYRAEMTRVRKNMDDRFGEMQYEKWFTNNIIKKTLHMSMLSVGWNWGFWRSHGGAVMDTSRMQLFGGRLRPMDDKSEITTRMAYVGLYTGWAALQGSMMTYMMTGRMEGVQDMIYPVMPDGSRVNTPFFTRVMGELYYHTRMSGVWGGMEKMAHNKLNPTTSGMIDLFNNKDWRGFEIYDPDADIGTQLQQMGKFMAIHALLPISVESSIGQKSPGRIAMNFLGFNKAPEYIKATDAEAFINKTFTHYHGAESQPYAEARKRDARSAVGRAYKLWRDETEPGMKTYLGNLYSRERDDYITKYRSSQADIEKALSMTKKYWDGPRFAFALQKLTPPQQEQALKMMEPEQRRQYLPFAQRVVRDRFEEDRENDPKIQGEFPKGFREGVQEEMRRPKPKPGPKVPPAYDFKPQWGPQ